MPSDLRVDRPTETLSDDDLSTILAYETQFLAARKLAEKLYCDRCFKANVHDGCRVSVAQSGLTGIVKIECRCRIVERKGATH